ncbi:MAG TPA: 50S ribosomal protein L25 [Phycisphaerae bacterium]|nr:50S ribosomal protein L25 [Phycisphaerae bacterium]HNU45240.1 50S ribosomal protein L25 [Phycisphaerae bacterium]
MEMLTLKAEPRTPGGTRTARALREKGSLPAIIYGHHEPPEPVTLHEHEVEVAIGHGARTLQVELNGEVKQYLIKEVQYDHLGLAPIHIDLARVDMHERVRVKVAIELRGVPKGVAEGGILEQLLGEVEVECRVTDIPETLRPVVTDMELGHVLCVKDVQLPPGVVAVTPPEDRVAVVKALVEAPEAAAPAVEGEAAAAEPERIGRVRPEEPAEDEGQKAKKKE